MPVKWTGAGDPNDPHGFIALRAAFQQALQVANYSERSVETFGIRLRPFFHWCVERGITQPREVTRALIERFDQWQFHYRKDDGNPLDVMTRKLCIGAIKSFFGWLAKKNLIPSNPASEIEYPKTGYRLPKAVLTPEEVEQVLAQPDLSTPIGLRDRALMELLYCTGIRRMEAAGLLLNDLSEQAGTVFIRKGKGDRDRMVPIGERALAWTRKYLSEARPQLVKDPEVQALFLNLNGGPIHPRSISKAGHKYVRQTGMNKPGSVHVFRHSMATAMLEGGADVRVIQEMLGHVSLLSTQVYTHVSIAKLKAVHAATHPAATLERKEHQSDEEGTK